MGAEKLSSLPSPRRLMGWAAQDREWHAISAELQGARPGEIVTAYQVTLEQKKRMLARGDHFMTYDEILEEWRQKSGLAEAIETAT